MRKWLRRARWLREQIDALLGILLCLLPLLRAYEDVRRLCKDDGE